MPLVFLQTLPLKFLCQLNPFVTNGTYMSHLQRLFSSPPG